VGVRGKTGRSSHLYVELILINLIGAVPSVEVALLLSLFGLFDTGSSSIRGQLLLRGTKRVIGRTIQTSVPRRGLLRNILTRDSGSTTFAR
jgi:hypothetical protein